MELLYDVVQTLLGLGAAVILPVMILLLGLVFGMKFGNALKAGLLVGIGFQGIGLIVGLLNSTLLPAVGYYEDLGAGFTIMDVGWPAAGAAVWAAPFAALSVPLGILVNLILLRLKLTKTMNVDIWNFIHFLVPGAVVYFLSGSFVAGLVTTVFFSAVTLFAADRVKDAWQEYFDLEGTTCSTLMFNAFVYPITWAVNRVIDFIPGLNKWDLSIEKANKHLGVFGDPIIIGLIVGAFLGLLTRQHYTTVLTMALGISAVMVLLPRMVSILMDGLAPIGVAARGFMQRFIGKEAEDTVIGMDVALGLGDPAVIATTVLTIPIVIALAFIIPGIEFFPVGVLLAVVYVACFCVLTSKGNLLRSLINSTIMMAIIIFLAQLVSPEATIVLSETMEVTGRATDLMFSTPWTAAIALFFRFIIGL